MSIVASPAASGSPEAASGALLALHGISKRFGATVALREVSLRFQPGRIHCLLGENGAGKSTIGKIAGGLYTADSGRLMWKGRQVSFRHINDAREQGIGLVFQELSLAPDLSVRANLRLGAEGSGHPFCRLRHQAETEQVVQALERFGLDIDLEEPVKHLPVSTQQMLEIAKALMRDPELVVLDEPTAMLGAVEKQRLFQALRAWRDAGKALVLITHHIEDVMELGDHVTVMRDGNVVDSFPMEPSITADDVLQRLTGRKIRIAKQACSNKVEGAWTLQVDNVLQRDGSTTSIRMGRGEIIGLYGVVGSGAEQIPRALIGLDGKTPLRFTLNGNPYRASSPATAFACGVSYLPSGRASNGIFATLSIRENLCLTQLGELGRFGVVSEPTERARTASLLEHFKVKYHDAEERITSLSGGNQQKVLMARAMARARHVLILEEPTAGIDIDAKLQNHDRVRELTERGVTVLLVSSDLIETITLCDTVYTFYEGHVVNCYEHPTLSDQPDIVFDVLGQASEEADTAVGASAGMGTNA